MSKLKEKSEYMAMRVSGFLGWLHRMVMLITFPIRKFWLIVSVLLIVLIILIAIPMFYGIQLRDVWDWYMVKMPNHEFVEAKDKALFGAKEQVDKIRRNFKEVLPDKKSVADKDESKQKKEIKLVSWNVAEFRKAKYVPQKQFPVIKKVEDLKEEKVAETKGDVVVIEEAEKPVNTVIVSEEVYVAPEQNTDTAIKARDELPVDEYDSDVSVNAVEEHIKTSPRIGNIENYYTKIRSADLVYLEEPEIREGEVKVIGPNSLYVDGNFVFLYGIYSHPRRHDINAAIRYLQNITAGRNVYCAAVAYSLKTQYPVALCFMNRVLLNRSLVDHNLAKNIALK